MTLDSYTKETPVINYLDSKGAIVFQTIINTFGSIDNIINYISAIIKIFKTTKNTFYSIYS